MTHPVFRTDWQRFVFLDIVGIERVQFCPASSNAASEMIIF